MLNRKSMLFLSNKIGEIVPSCFLFFLIIVLMISLQVQAETVQINFDTDPSGTPIPNGTAVNNVYASWGVTFEDDPSGSACGPNVYANNNQPSGFGSPPNVVSTCAPPTASDISENGFGMIHAIFTRFASRVCIDVRPDGGSHYAIIRAYGASDSLLSSVTSTPGVTETLCISGTGIRGVRFSGYNDLFARFDNLSVTFVPTMDDNARGNAALAYWQASPDELSTLIIIQNTKYSVADRYVQYRIRGECSTNQIYNGCIHLTPGDSIPLWIHISGGDLILTNVEAGADIATLDTGVTDEKRGYLELTCWITACCSGLAGNDMAVRTVLIGTDWWVGINAAMVQDWADTGANICVVDDEELPTYSEYWGRYWSDENTHGRLITVFPGGFDASCQCSISGHGWDESANNESYSKTVKEVAKTPIGDYEGISPYIDIPTDATAGAIEITGVTEPMFGFVLMEDPSIRADALPLFR